MELVQNYFSPQSSTGAGAFSILAHVLIYGAMVWLLSHASTKKDASESYIDMSYQTFEEPPVQVKQVQKVRHASEAATPVNPKVQPDTLAKELQDEKSEISGTQQAKEAANVGATANGTAVSTPYYKLKPKYPRAALLAGTEGWVLMQIDINESGEVENIRVVDGEQRNLFQSEARRAVSQWKYRPFVDGSGRPQRKTDHQVRVDFKLNETEATGS